VEWELSLFLRNKEVALGILEKMRDIVHVGPAIRCVCVVCVCVCVCVCVYIILCVCVCVCVCCVCVLSLSL
jgi:hypothetical protein